MQKSLVRWDLFQDKRIFLTRSETPPSSCVDWESVTYGSTHYALYKTMKLMLGFKLIRWTQSTRMPCLCLLRQLVMMRMLVCQAWCEALVSSANTSRMLDNFNLQICWATSENLLLEVCGIVEPGPIRKEFLLVGSWPLRKINS